MKKIVTKPESKNKLKILKVVAKYVIYLVCFLVMFVAELNGALPPFAPMFLFALMWCSQSVWLLGGVYFVSALCVSVQIPFLVSAVATVFVMILFYYFHKFIKKPMRPLLVWVYAMMSQVAFAYYFLPVVSISMVVYFFVATVFLFACINVLEAIFLRGIFYRFTLDESICLFVLVTVMGAGLASVDVGGYIHLYKVLAVLVGLLLICLGKQSVAIIMAVAVGLGAGLYAMDMGVMFPLVLVITAASIFRYPYRVFMVLASVLVELGVVYVFSSQISVFTALSVAVGGILLLLIPNGYIMSLTDKWYTAMSEVSMRNMVLVTRKNIRKRMLSLSGVFKDMERLYHGMVKGSLTRLQVKDMLYSEVSSSVCSDCPERNRCLRGSVYRGEENLKTMIDLAIDKGRLTILDMPKQLSINCVRSNSVLGKINQIVSQFASYNTMSQNIDNAKILLSETLGGVSRLLVNLGDEIDKNITFDSDRESKIQSKLLAENIICGEIMLYAESLDKVTATLVIKGDNGYSPLIEKIVSGVCNTAMAILEVYPSERSGWQIVSLGRKNRYEISFGLASCKKAGSSISGDCHSLIRLGANKFLLALSDGMGSGEKAEKLSALTIGLIENFYRAGFDNEVVLSNVNKLLAVNNSDAYSALDIVLIDLDLGIADLIKVGAPYGLIKRLDRVERVSGGALPIGVLDQMVPSIVRTTIEVSDIVIMVTDGITDAYGDVDEFAEFVAGVSVSNPQTVADTILADALSRNGGIAKDDMTVLISKMYQNH